MKTLFLFLAFWFSCSGVLADGKFYPPAAYPVAVTIPDQRALIQFSNGVERLVIDTRFSTSATNVAWVVPLPARPTVEAATAGLFPTLEFLFRPEVVHYPQRRYVLPLCLGGVGFLIMTVRKTGRLNLGDAIACLALGMLAGAAGGSPLGGLIMLTPFLLWVVHSLRSGQAYMVPVIVVLMLLVLGFLLPAFTLGSSKASASGPPVPGVDILDRRLVGAYETTTLSATDPRALESWLNSNGFAMLTNTQPVVDAYVKQGWVFVAAKVTGDSSARTNSVHPLIFTFPTSRAVYPMRLTGVGAESLDLELYVFGAQRAGAPHVKVEHCARVTFPKPGTGWRSREPDLPVLHPGLRACVQGAGVATKLTGRLAGAGLADDVWIDWVPFQSHRTVLYSNAVALDTTVGRVAWPAMVLVLAGTAWFRWGPAGQRWHGLWGALAVALGLAVYGLQVWINLPRTEVRLVKRPWISAKQSALELRLLLEDLPASERGSLEAARSTFRQELASAPAQSTLRHFRTNAWLGGLVREEDSPGNYRLASGTNGLELVWYDEFGGENRFDR